MKKTLTINLNGYVFNIDEDAYQVLNQYLEDLGRHFAADEKEEILNDIEARVAELFSEKLVHRNVVELHDVQEVINQLGQPNQFEDESGTQASAQTAEPQQNFTANERRKVRKLYRDTANKRIGGVAAGVAAFFNLDITLVRILFILILILSFGWTLFIYILMWIFVPEAKSVAQRLEMQGVEPNIDNISSHTEDMSNVTERKPSAFTKVIKILAIVVLSCIGIGLFTSVLGVLIATSMLIFHLLPIPVSINEIILLICIGIFLVCPAIAIVMFCSYLINGKKPCHKWVAWVLFSFWIASIVGLGVLSVNGYYNKDKWKSSIWNKLQNWDWDDDDENLTLNFVDEMRDSQDFHAIDASEAINVIFTQRDSTTVDVKAPQHLISRVRTEIRNGILYIRNDNKRMNGKERIKVFVTAPSIDKVCISEACTFESKSDVTLSRLELIAEEASHVEITGTIDTLTVKADEASHVVMNGVVSQQAEIRADEASEVNMGLAKDLKIVSNEASVVTYKGKPLRLIRSSSEVSVITQR